MVIVRNWSSGDTCLLVNMSFEMLKIWICSPLNHIFLNFPNYELRFSKDILFQIFRNI